MILYETLARPFNAAKGLPKGLARYATLFAGLGVVWVLSEVVAAAQQAQTNYSPPLVVDTRGKVVGHYASSSLVDIQIPSGPVVEMTFTPLDGLASAFSIGTLYYRTLDCTGTSYLQSNVLAPRAIYINRTRQIVYPAGKTVVIFVHAERQYGKSGGQPECSQTNFRTAAVPAATFSLDALDVSPPFKVRLK